MLAIRFNLCYMCVQYCLQFKRKRKFFVTSSTTLYLEFQECVCCSLRRSHAYKTNICNGKNLRYFHKTITDKYLGIHLYKIIFTLYTLHFYIDMLILSFLPLLIFGVCLYQVWGLKQKQILKLISC